MRSLRVAVLEILPKHLLGPSNRHGPYMPQAEEAVTNERVLFLVLETAQQKHQTMTDDVSKLPVADCDTNLI
jgi:hypothetical protein